MKKFKSLKVKRCLVGCCLSICFIVFSSGSAFAGSQALPYNFAAGTAAIADDVNANFNFLKERSWDKTGTDIYFNDGKVGIGTTTPSAKLAIEGSVSTLNGVGMLLFNSNAGNSNKWVLGVGGGTVGAGDFSIGDSSSYKFVINSSGNVGIGTTTPTAKLSVEGSSGLDSRITIRATGTTAGNVPSLSFQSTESGGLTVKSRITSGEVGGASTEGFMAFETKQAGTLTGAMVIDNKGNVGIGGTTSPTQKLEVDGGVRLNTAAAQPTCDSTSRGTLWFKQDDAVGDILYACGMNNSQIYNWLAVAVFP